MTDPTEGLPGNPGAIDIGDVGRALVNGAEAFALGMCADNTELYNTAHDRAQYLARTACDVYDGYEEHPAMEQLEGALARLLVGFTDPTNPLRTVRDGAVLGMIVDLRERMVDREAVDDPMSLFASLVDIISAQLFLLRRRLGAGPGIMQLDQDVVLEMVASELEMMAHRIIGKDIALDE